MKPNLTPADIGEARILLNTGATMAAVARRFGVDYETIKRKIDPEFAQRRRDQRRRSEKNQAVIKPTVKKAPAKKSIRPITAAGNVAAFRPTEAEFLAAQKLIPLDTRDLTARLLGDPLPGRRALDMRGAK